MAPRASGLCTSQPQRSCLAPDPLIGLKPGKSQNMSELYIVASWLLHSFFFCGLCEVVLLLMLAFSHQCGATHPEASAYPLSRGCDMLNYI